MSLGERLFLKGYRRVRPGVNPELEVGRFLTEVARFRNCVPLAGALEYTGTDGTSFTLALLQGYVANQGDGWTYTLDHLEHFLDEHRTPPAQPVPEDVHGAFLELMATLGQRTAELHLALATAQRRSRLRAGTHRAAPMSPHGSGRSLKKRRKRSTSWSAAAIDFPAPVRDGLDALLDARQRLLARIQASAGTRFDGLKTRYHGDYHLGQVLLSKNDFVIIDFEGEPARPLAQRRQKHSPLRDVAEHAALVQLRPSHRAAARDRAPAGEPCHARAADPELGKAGSRRPSCAPTPKHVSGSPLYGSFDAARPLLELFELEKAFYELRYELNHRPDWAVVPLRGILSYG